MSDRDVTLRAIDDRAVLQVRPGAWGDRAAIVHLIATMGGHDDVATHDDALRELGGILRDSDARTVVAQCDGRVVGVAVLQARASLTSDARVGWLSAFAIEASRRRAGIGSVLLDAVDDAARTLGCARIDVQSSAWRAGAHAFYRTRGFAESAQAARFSRAVAPVPHDASLAARFLAAAARAASAVNAAIVELGGSPAVGMGADGARTEAADRAAESAAIGILETLGLPIVSEEAGLVGPTPRAGEAWVSLDPLDGSRNFRAGHPPYAIAIGLVRDGVALAGFVCDLSSGRRWYAGDDGIAYADGARITARRGELIGMSSPTRDRSVARPRDIAHRVRISGSCAIDLCRVADGALGAFLGVDRPVVHTHDLAGPLAIITAAGGVAYDISGRTPLLEPDPTKTYAIVAAADDGLAHDVLRDARR
ncbi:MAG: hypothetical protein NVS1B2_20890 [Vulcanimicrobiaceae bacterium]